MTPQLCGWVQDEREVERVWNTMPTPFFATPEPENKDVYNHIAFRDAVGHWHDEGPQLIGDCVSWGNGRLVDYTAVIEGILAGTNELFEPTATEVIYALSRVEIGQRRLGNGDGSVGAWAAQAVTRYGTISRPHLDRLGVGGAYSGRRAKDWGYQGLPDSLEPAARDHLIEDMTPVRNFKEFAWHCQQGRVTAVCSNIGFETGGPMTVMRDAEGFSRPRGSWGHCMGLVSVRMGRRPGGLLTNQWPLGAVHGPMGSVEIPPCSWWVDADVIDAMLAQNDSFTGTKYKGYPARQLTWRF